jgi:hypothetical protein
MKDLLRCILIDANTRLVNEIYIEDNIKKIREYLKIDQVDVIKINETTDLITDEHGLIKINDETPIFIIEGFPEPFINKAILMSKNKIGYPIDSQINVEEIKKSIKFSTLKALTSKAIV